MTKKNLSAVAVATKMVIAYSVVATATGQIADADLNLLFSCKIKNAIINSGQHPDKTFVDSK